MTTPRKIALVTGSSRGLGKDMALNIARKGIDVIVTYNNNREDAQHVVAEIETIGQKATALQLNVGEVSSFGRFIQELQKTLKDHFNATGFDYLINNAGVGLHVPSFAETTEAQFDELMNIHFKGAFFLTQKALTLLNNDGGIVNISTGLTRVAFPGSGAYASMKGAMEVMTRYMAKELGTRNINVNSVAPGAVATDFGGGRLRSNPQMQEYLKGVTAIPRIAYAEDIGGVVAFLCTPDAKWINGQRIEVSGGMVL